MPTYEASTTTAASPEAAWARWTDVSRWTENEAIEAASIDGAFRPGATIRSKARGFPEATLELTVVDEPREWVDEASAPGVRMAYHHLIEPLDDGGCRLTERVVITGAASRAVGPALRGRLEALFAASVEHVARSAMDGGG
jgi:hypothetical protein